MKNKMVMNMVVIMMGVMVIGDHHDAKFAYSREVAAMMMSAFLRACRLTSISNMTSSSIVTSFIAIKLTTDHLHKTSGSTDAILLLINAMVSAD